MEEKNIEVLISEKDILKRVQEIGDQITKDYAGKKIKLICVLRGGTIFFAELAKRIQLPVEFDFISVSSYGNGTQSSGDIRVKTDLSDSVEGWDVIVVEDIVDSGNTVNKLLALLKERGAATVALASLLDKPSRRQVEVPIDYIGFEVPDVFIVGYGLDYAQQYRNLPFVGKVNL